jgi:hypothetical protein
LFSGNAGLETAGPYDTLYQTLLPESPAPGRRIITPSDREMIQKIRSKKYILQSSEMDIHRFKNKPTK